MIRLTDVVAVELPTAAAPNRISKLGIELEGGWNNPPAGFEITRDSSVHFEGADPHARERWVQQEFQRRWSAAGGYPDGGRQLQIDIINEWAMRHPPAAATAGPRVSGEIPSPPLPIDKWIDWIRLCYPSHVNATCGMHVHLSFESPLVYQRLMNPRYPKTVIEEFKKWAKLREYPADSPLHLRLYGEGKPGTPSEYCQPIFQADEQARRTEKRFNHYELGCRYTVMNYSWAINNRRTIECRLLPMFETVEVAIEAINELLRITNAFLYQKRKKEPIIITAVKSTGEELNRRIEVRV